MLKMFRLLFLIAALLSLGAAISFADGQSNSGTLTYGDKQVMFEKAFKEFKQADENLNNVYEQILNKHKDDSVFIAKITNAQSAWLAFRNAEIEAIFPSQDKKVYGSLYPLAYAQEKTRLTLERAKQLNQWLVGVPVGTIGAGSRGYIKADK
jgi:uncharacterized protein YecT (DUF1311 family)